MTKKFEFEHAMNELESLVQTLEKGELPLEDSLKLFEKGVTLTRQCQQALSEAEQQVAILVKKNGDLSLESFEHDAD